MGLGAFPASGKDWLGMLGMHGTYEANMAMHDCDVMICIGARFDDRITGRLDAFSPGSKKIHIDIDPSSINKTVQVDVPIIGDVAHVLEEMIRVWKAQGRHRRQDGAEGLVGADRRVAAPRIACSYKKLDDVIMPQYAIQRLYELTKDRDIYITTEVGQHQMWAAQFFHFEEPEPLDDLGRPRHHGLWPAGRHRRADGAPQVAGHRHRRRCLGPDEHAGDVHGGAVPPAGQGVHPQQPVHGHGAAVAAAAARQPHLARATRKRCRIS